MVFVPHSRKKKIPRCVSAGGGEGCRKEDDVSGGGIKEGDVTAGEVGCIKEDDIIAGGGVHKGR